MKQKMIQGFTLVELMVVIVILGILATVVAMNVGGMDDEAKTAKAKAEVKSLFDAVGMFKLRVQEYPESLEELIEGPSSGDYEGSWTSLLTSRSVPKDPWKHEYKYEYDEEMGITITCYGKDGEPEGEGFNKDIMFPEEADE